MNVGVFVNVDVNVKVSIGVRVGRNKPTVVNEAMPMQKQITMTIIRLPQPITIFPSIPCFLKAFDSCTNTDLAVCMFSPFLSDFKPTRILVLQGRESI